jgi:hypothetical protein
MLGGCNRRKNLTDAATTEQSSAAKPTIDFDSRMHEFGIVNEGATPKHLFTVRNTGAAPLLLRDVRASCGCTLAVVKTEVIPPGGSGAIEITFATRGFPGPSHNTITVVSNDPSSPESILEFTANVERLLDFERRSLHLDTHYRVSKVEQVWLTGKFAEHAELKVTRSQGDQNVRARPIRQRGNVNRMGLELKVKADRVASGEGTVTVSTGLVYPSELELTFTYSVRAN